MAFNNWPWTSLQNLNLDWLLKKVKEALTKSEEAKTTANGIAGTANSALSTANQAIEIAEHARELAEDNGLPHTDTNDYGKLLGVDMNGDWGITEYPQQVLGISENTNDVSITLRSIGGAFPQTVNVPKSDAGRYYIDFAVDSTDISQISTVTSNRTFTDISNAYASGKHIVIRIKYNGLTLFESDTMRLFNPRGSAQAFQFLLALSVNNGVGKYTYAFVNSNDAVNILEASLPSSTDTVQFIAQSLTDSQKAQARSNIGAGKSTVTVSNGVMTIVDNNTGSVSAYPIGGSPQPTYENYTIDYKGFEVGALTSGSGAIYASHNRIVSTQQIKLSDFVSYSANTNWYNKYAFYDSNRVYLGTSYDIGWTHTFFTSDMAPQNAEYMRIIAYRSGTTSEDYYTETDLIEADPIITMRRSVSGITEKYGNRYKLNGFELIAYSSVGIAAINSVEHFQYCAEREYDMLKCDIQPTSDGKLILCHDEGFTIDSNGRITTYDSNNQILIHDITESAALNYRYATQYDGDYCHVASIDDYLSICKKYKLVPYITIRNTHRSETVNALKIAIYKYGFQNKCVINSDSADTLSAVRDSINGATLCLFCNPFSTIEPAYNFVNTYEDCILSYFYTQENHTWSDFINDPTVNDIVSECNENGYMQIVCIESDNSHIDDLINMGFDGCHTTYGNQPIVIKTIDNLPVYSGGVI